MQSSKPIKILKTSQFQAPLKMRILAKHKRARLLFFIRSTILTLTHGDVYTPVYMPVGTKGSIKGILSQQMEFLGCKIFLCNTYHLGNKPGADYLQKFGGIHKFINWKKNILTDSGGFQMVSLKDLMEVNQQGVKFKNPYDNSLMFMKPQDSIHIQNKIGSDIMMPLDDVVKTTRQKKQIEKSMERTIRWLDRNISANKNINKQCLFPIIQGGIIPQLRIKCCQAFINKQVYGYAIGGLSGGQDKQDFWKIVSLCTSLLPQDKPRYLMGVGYPQDMIMCTLLGVDMFDCVFATRTARFGTAITRKGLLKIGKKFQKDFTAIDDQCSCLTCLNYTKSYLSTIVGMEIFCNLISHHNLHYVFNLMKNLHQAIIDSKLQQFVGNFLKTYFSEKEIPVWIKQVLNNEQIIIDKYLQ